MEMSRGVVLHCGSITGASDTAAMAGRAAASPAGPRCGGCCLFARQGRGRDVWRAGVRAWTLARRLSRTAFLLGFLTSDCRRASSSHSLYPPPPPTPPAGVLCAPSGLPPPFAPASLVLPSLLTGIGSHKGSQQSHCFAVDTLYLTLFAPLTPFDRRSSRRYGE